MFYKNGISVLIMHSILFVIFVDFLCYEYLLASCFDTQQRRYDYPEIHIFKRSIKIRALLTNLFFKYGDVNQQL